jgi:L-lactate dehydrogenase complex protein LldG
MTSRTEILAALAKVQDRSVPYPSWRCRDNDGNPLQSTFQDVLLEVGGTAIEVADEQQALRVIEALPVFQSASCFWSSLQDHSRSGKVISSASRPQDLDPLQLCIARGEFAVAENAAVWVAAQSLPHRAVLFMAEHLVLVLRADQVVANLHVAYERLEAEVLESGYFISGPSKTADIEQHLIFGAQGPRTATVVLVGGAGAAA